MESRPLLVKLLSWECHRIRLIRNQHWFRWWLGDVGQQAITLVNADPDLYRDMVLLGLNELIWSIKFPAVVNSQPPKLVLHNRGRYWSALMWWLLMLSSGHLSCINSWSAETIPYVRMEAMMTWEKCLILWSALCLLMTKHCQITKKWIHRMYTGQALVWSTYRSGGEVAYSISFFNLKIFVLVFKYHWKNSLLSII